MEFNCKSGLTQVGRSSTSFELISLTPGSNNRVIQYGLYGNTYSSDEAQDLLEEVAPKNFEQGD